MNIGDRVIVKENIKFYKNRTGKIVDNMIYNDKKKFKVILDNFNDIPLWFYDDEIKLKEDHYVSNQGFRSQKGF